MSETAKDQEAIRDYLNGIIEALQPVLNGYGRVAFFEEIARRLSAAIRREKPWGWRYISGVSSGQHDASRDLERAITVLGAMMDGLSRDAADVVAVEVYAAPGSVRPGSLLMGKSRFCKYPPCGISFVPEYGQAKYCCKEHRMADYRRRKFTAETPLASPKARRRTRRKH
jgi:hypothetical protein